MSENNNDLKIVTKQKKPNINLKSYIKSNKKPKDKKLPIVRTKQEKEKMSKKEKILCAIKVTLTSLAVLITSGVIVGFLILLGWMQDMPELDTSLLQESAQSSYIYDIDGNVIAKFSSSESRSWVKLEDIPEDLVDAFISIEDIRFYEHKGVDIKRFGSAVLGQFMGDSHGGSTITQQLIKNVYLTNEVTYKRKVQEIVLALQLEQKMSKDDILEAYLNIIYFGGSNYGVKSAAEDYFGKSLNELTLKECALLAGLTKNPNGYSPRLNMYVRKDMTPTDTRTTNVLWNMHDKGFITDEEYEKALAEEYNIKEESSSTSIYAYPHFVEYVITDVVDDMLEKEGLEDNGTNRAILEWRIRSGGYKIYTTLDASAQENLQESATNYDNYPVIKTDEIALPEVAAVVMDQDKGHIVAMIGSRVEPTSYKTLNRAVKNTMPIGSSIKPLSAYAPIVERGAGTGSIGYNFAFKIEGYDHTIDYPAGSMGSQKTMTYKNALQVSSNVVPASIIAKEIGFDLSKQYLMQMGISEESIQKNGSGLALGSSGIDMLELTAAYCVLSNGGTYYEPKSYTTVVDRHDKVLLDSKDYQIKREVFTKSTSWLMTNMLEAVIEYSNHVMGVEGIKTAGKTGTHQDKCAVFAGYTNYYTSAVWIGSDNYASFKHISGGTHAGILFADYMTKIHKSKNLTDKDILDYTMEDAHIVPCNICNISGLVANELCAENGCVVTEYYKDGTQPTNTCNMHVTKQLCRSTHALTTSTCPTWAIYEKKGLFIPSDSYLSVITRELVKQVYPDAIFEDELAYCTYHSSNSNYISDAHITNIKLLITNFENLKLTDKPTPDEILVIDSAIVELNTMLTNISNASSQDLINMTDGIIARYDELNVYYNTINSREQILPEENVNENEIIPTPEDTTPPEEEPGNIVDEIIDGIIDLIPGAEEEPIN